MYLGMSVPVSDAGRRFPEAFRPRSLTTLPWNPNGVSS